MKQQNFDINKMRVASPCSVGWETMTGDERVRRCDSCELNIYNIAEMTKPEVENLVKTHEGRLCIRLYKRADGTVLTKDCPVGIRAFYKRTARFAGAALSAILGLFSFGFGQIDSNNETACKRKGKIFRNESRNLNLVEGTILDPNCAVIPGAKITLINQDTNHKSQIETNKKGYYRVILLAPGRYQYKVEANGFMSYGRNFKIRSNESVQLNIILDIGGFVGIIDIDDEDSIIDLKSSGITTTITNNEFD